MDYEAMSEAYRSASRQEKSVGMYPDGRYSETFSDNKKNKQMDKVTNYIPNREIEYDYSIVRMPSGTHVVARSRNLGSLDYDFVCECSSRHEAHEIVKALSK